MKIRRLLAACCLSSLCSVCCCTAEENDMNQAAHSAYEAVLKEYRDFFHEDLSGLEKSENRTMSIDEGMLRIRYPDLCWWLVNMDMTALSHDLDTFFRYAYLDVDRNGIDELLVAEGSEIRLPMATQFRIMIAPI